MLHIDLSGNIALVTGATGELGRVIVRTLAQTSRFITGAISAKLRHSWPT